jgi:hypothetical protein
MVVLVGVTHTENVDTSLTDGSVPVIMDGLVKVVMLPWRWFVMTWRIMTEV